MAAGGLVSCYQDFGDFCFDLTICEISAVFVWLMCLQQLIQRKKTLDQQTRKKNNIYLLIIICLSCNIIFNIAQNTLLIVYFLQLYIYYLFLIYIVYYFSRKTAKIKSLQQNKFQYYAYYCYFLTGFFTLFLIWNICDYIMSFEQQYQLCQQQIFHIVRIIGFLIDIVLVIIAHQLNYIIKRGISKNSTLLQSKQETEEFQKKANKQRFKFWSLVIATFVGQFMYFIEDVYFLIQGPNSSCQFYNELVENQAHFYEYIILFFLIIIELQIPFLMTLYAFWFKQKKKQQQQQSQSFEILSDNPYQVIKESKTTSNSTDQYNSLNS